MDPNALSDDIRDGVADAQQQHHDGNAVGARERLVDLEAKVHQMLLNPDVESRLALEHLLIWVIEVRGALGGDVGDLRTAQDAFSRALALALDFERDCSRHGLECFGIQIAQTVDYLSEVMCWRSNYKDAIALLVETFGRFNDLRHAGINNVINALIKDIDARGTVLGHEKLSSKLGLISIVGDSSFVEMQSNLAWQQPAPHLGREYRNLNRKYEESSAAVRAKDRSSGTEQLEASRTRMEILDEWLLYSPLSVGVRRLQIAADFDQAILLVGLRRFDELYVTWQKIRANIDWLSDPLNEWEDLPRYLARYISSLVSAVLIQRKGEDDGGKFRERLVFAQTCALYANNLLEGRRKRAPISVAEALTWERVTTRLIEIYTTGDTTELIKTRKMLRARRLIILDHVLDGDPENDRARMLLEQYGGLENSRTIKQRIELKTWKWNIQPIA
jgi:hypothetical protein